MYLSYIGEGEAGSPVCQIPSDKSQEKTHWTLRKMDVRFDVEEIRTSSSEDWENERIFAVNKEKGRATLRLIRLWRLCRLQDRQDRASARLRSEGRRLTSMTRRCCSRVSTGMISIRSMEGL